MRRFIWCTNISFEHCIFTSKWSHELTLVFYGVRVAQLIGFCVVCSSWRRVWGYQRGNQNPYIEEEQIPQRPKEKVQKDKQRSTKHTHKTKDRETRTPLNTGGELRYSVSPSGTRRVNLVTNIFEQQCS
jgi:hypothetical protein